VFSVTGGNAENDIGASRDTTVLMSASFLKTWNTCVNMSA